MTVEDFVHQIMMWPNPYTGENGYETAARKLLGQPMPDSILANDLERWLERG